MKSSCPHFVEGVNKVIIQKVYYFYNLVLDMKSIFYCKCFDGYMMDTKLIHFTASKTGTS